LAAETVKGAGTTITLSISSTKPGATGAFRIVGLVKGTPDRERQAAATLKELDDSIADLWVSVAASSSSSGPKKK
jgi:hypothetical protein